MKKYSEIKEKIRILNRIYLIQIDKVVFLITLISLFWIFGYKLFMINIEPLYTNTYNIAANIADITYTIFSSIVAASIFYIVTVFLPRFNAINNMRRNIVPDLLHINNMIKNIVVTVNKENTNIKYTFEEFSTIIHNKQHKLDLEKVEKDFVSHFCESNLLEGLKVTISYLKNYIEPIYLNYSNILPQVIIEQLTDYKFRNFDLSNLSKDKKGIYDILFMQIVQSIMITNLFKIYYDLKE